MMMMMMMRTMMIIPHHLTNREALKRLRTSSLSTHLQTFDQETAENLFTEQTRLKFALDKLVNDFCLSYNLMGLSETLLAIETLLKFGEEREPKYSHQESLLVCFLWSEPKYKRVPGFNYKPTCV